jgi:hypothetical protein
MTDMVMGAAASIAVENITTENIVVMVIIADH